MEIKNVLNFFNLNMNDNTEIKDVYDNSKHVSKNSIFIAIDSGVNYIEDAIQNGAELVLSNVDINHVKVIYIPQLKTKLTPFLLYFYHNPASKLSLIGVTGTNGKSTSAYLIHAILKKALLITTIPNIKHSVMSNNTTPSGVELVHIFNYAIRHGYKYLVMEVSSIGIKEHRVDGLNFDYLLFTNLTSDHLDYHGSIEEYHKVKLDFLGSQNAIIIVNDDDQVCRKHKQIFSKMMSYKVDQSMIVLNDENGIIYQYDKNHTIFISMLGTYNLSNAIGAITLCSLELPLKRIIKKLKNVKPLLGRLNIVAHNPLVIIDYAHTESALAASLSEVKKIVDGNLIVVFGAGGERDKTKRVLYGNVVKKYAYLGIITNDNPRFEDEQQIIDDIINDSEHNFIIERNRSEAIRLSLSRARKNDAIVITGKGHEQYQIIKGKSIPYSDYAEVRKWIKHR